MKPFKWQRLKAIVSLNWYDVTKEKKMRTMFCVLVSSVPSSDAGPSVVWCAPWGSSEGSHRQAEEPDAAGLRSNKGFLWSTYGCSLGPSPWRKITWEKIHQFNDNDDTQFRIIRNNPILILLYSRFAMHRTEFKKKLPNVNWCWSC
jgi:hypothetical protein